MSSTSQPTLCNAVSSIGSLGSLVGHKKSLCVTFELTVYAWPSRYFDGLPLILILEKKSSVGDSLFSPSVLAADNRPR